MKPSIKPPPPINRQRRPQKKYKSAPLDWRDAVSGPWLKIFGIVAASFICISLLVKFWPDRGVNPDKEMIAKVESIGHSATRVEPVKLPASGSDQVPEIVEVEKKRIIGHSSEDLSGHFVSVVASMENIDSAIEMHQDLRKAEINSEIIEDFSKERLWYRVVASRSTAKSEVIRASRRYDFDTWITSLTSQAKLIVSYD